MSTSVLFWRRIDVEGLEATCAPRSPTPIEPIIDDREYGEARGGAPRRNRP